MKIEDLDKLLKVNKEHKNQYSQEITAEKLIEEITWKMNKKK
jgi:hypothetical protein